MVPMPVLSAQKCLLAPNAVTKVLEAAPTARLLVCPTVVSLLPREDSVALDFRLEACLLLSTRPPKQDVEALEFNRNVLPLLVLLAH